MIRSPETDLNRTAPHKPAGAPVAKINHLLSALPQADWLRWQPQLQYLEMPLRLVVCESNRKTSHVYFPTTAVVSLLYVMQNGATAEIAGVGNEGVVGISSFMGGDSSPGRAVVQSAGYGYRLPADFMRAEFDHGGAVMKLMLRYTQALIAQTAQTAACNRHHTLDKQLCRKLLLSMDRLPGNDLVMTQELIARLLGVRREGVTEAAVSLQAAGLIRYARGRITVIDRPALERRSCECYAVVKREYDRLLPASAAAC